MVVPNGAVIPRGNMMNARARCQKGIPPAPACTETIRTVKKLKNARMKKPVHIAPTIAVREQRAPPIGTDAFGCDCGFTGIESFFSDGYTGGVPAIVSTSVFTWLACW